MKIEIDSDDIFSQWIDYKDGNEYALAPNYNRANDEVSLASDFHVFIWDKTATEWTSARSLGRLEARILSEYLKQKQRREKVADTLKNFRQLLKQPFGEE